MPSRHLITAIILLGSLAGCTGQGDQAAADADSAGDREPPRAVFADPEPRPATRTDTIGLEGMPTPMQLRLFQTEEDFPLPFSTYVPPDMAAEVEETAGAGASARFVAEFGGRRNDRAFVHLYVFPAGTDRNTAIASVRAYGESRGIPVSQGLEPIQEPDVTDRMRWAIEPYTFRYQSGGQWFMGTIGVGQHNDRYYQLVRHHPAEYADGFAPRADLIYELWRWADGTGLQPDQREPPPIVGGVDSRP